jgi:hypothetical protein
LGAVYIPPDSGHEEEKSFAHLEEIEQALARTPHLLLPGEFNAQVGNLEIMSRMKSMLFSTAHIPPLQCLFAGDMSYSQR